MDAVEHAGTGHPGTAMALAPIAHLLYQRHVRHDPAHPEWLGRDRFVLSCGHASIVQYVQLYLTGYGLDIDDLKAFRRLGSRTPGHPEYGHTAGVEATTGPLGQGLATAVGMAAGFAHERALYDPDADESTSPFDRTVWVLCSDGDLQEGVSYEAAAFAGHQRLGNLVVVYDDNEIQIEGSTSLAHSEDIRTRFEAQGWHVQRVALGGDGDIDAAAVDAALTTAAANRSRPSLVVVRSQIAWPAPNATGTAAAHGSPLGAAEAMATRELLAPGSEPFQVDDSVLSFTRRAVERGARLREASVAAFAAWERRMPEKAAAFTRALSGAVPEGLLETLPTWRPGELVSTRDASGVTIQRLAASIPELWGGSADLAEPNRTSIIHGGSFGPGAHDGRNVHWGVREHAMAAAMNGILLAGRSRFFAGTFLAFSDYQRPAIRLAALMRLPALYIFTHDSVALGADGPTHQPIEQLAGLRAIPGLAVVRPADANETAAAWCASLESKTPVALILARQPVEVAATAPDAVRRGVRRGAYVVHEHQRPHCVIVGTGSEVPLAISAARALEMEGIHARVVSMPCREWFFGQPRSYQDEVLPMHLPRIVVEAATTFGWADLTKDIGTVVGIDVFGVSASAEDALRERGMTIQHVIERVREVLRPAVSRY
ncbi:MAG: transketolase [Microbacteriaceae bacterium]|nr:MAG: transketolase [Microbacteriaceae bacterium]